MHKKTILVQDKIDNYTTVYDIKYKDTECQDGFFKFIFSKKDSGWNPALVGKSALSIKNDGNGYILEFENNSVRIDYSTWQLLSIFIQKFDKTSLDSKVFEIRELK